MKFNVMQVGVMAGAKGDIFWDLAPWIVYAAGYDLGCNIKIANPGDQPQEYALMAELTSGTTVISEESLPVFGHAKFTVEPGDFIELEGALRFSCSNAVLTVKLVDPASGEVIDSVATLLVAPSTSTASLPPTWPGTTTTPGTTDWTSWLNALMPVIMFTLVGIVMVSALRPKTEKAPLPVGRSA
jgi:hypothetical protein